MRVSKRIILTGVICIYFIVAGCRSDVPTFFISPDVDFSFIKKVAVLPLDNLSGKGQADEIIRKVVISELLASGFVDVVVPGEVITAVKKMGIKDISSLDSGHIQSLAKTLKVQALVLGSVEKFELTNISGTVAPEVTITLMMAEGSSGSIIWSATRTRGGATFMQRHFGMKSDTMSETVLMVVRDTIRTLYEY